MPVSDCAAGPRQIGHLITTQSNAEGEGATTTQTPSTTPKQILLHTGRERPFMHAVQEKTKDQTRRAPPAKLQGANPSAKSKMD